MEKSVEWGFDTYMQEIFQMKEVDIKEYSRNRASIAMAKTMPMG